MVRAATEQAVMASITGLIAKENIVATFGVIYGFAEVAEDGVEYWGQLATDMGATAALAALAGFSFLVFNLLCAPCFAAMGAIRKEMNNAKWSIGAIAYMTGFAYAMCLVVYQLGTLINGGAFGIGTIAAILTLGAFLFLLFRKNKNKN